MPGHDGRVVPVMLRHGTAQPQGVLAENWAGGTPMLSRPRPAGVAALVLPQDFRMLLRKPQRRAGGRGCKVDGDAGMVKLVDDPVEPPEIVDAFLGFYRTPCENTKGHDIDPGLVHELDIFIPDGFRPLFGIVVTAVPDTPGCIVQRSRPAMCSACCHGAPTVCVRLPMFTIPLTAVFFLDGASYLAARVFSACAPPHRSPKCHRSRRMSGSPARLNAGTGPPTRVQSARRESRFSRSLARSHLRTACGSW